MTQTETPTAEAGMTTLRDALEKLIEIADVTGDSVNTCIMDDAIQNARNALAQSKEENQALHIVFDGPPGPQAGRFVEVETSDGHSVSIGSWHERGDGLWDLRIPASAGEGDLWEADPFAVDAVACVMMDAGVNKERAWSFAQKALANLAALARPVAPAMAVPAERFVALSNAITEIHDHISTPEGMECWNRLNASDPALGLAASVILERDEIAKVIYDIVFGDPGWRLALMQAGQFPCLPIARRVDLCRNAADAILATRPTSPAPTPSPESTISAAHVATRDGGGDLSLADQAKHHGRDWSVWWQGSGERGDHIMEVRQGGSGYARELAFIGSDFHEQAGALVAEHNEQVRRLREVIGRQAAAKGLLQAELGRIKAIIPASLSYEVPDAAEAIASTFREYVKVAAEATDLRKAALATRTPAGAAGDPVERERVARIIARMIGHALDYEEVSTLNQYVEDHWQDHFWELDEIIGMHSSNLEDAERLNWLDQVARKSRTGISFDHISSVEGEASGFRFMRRFFIGEARKSLRSAIDAARGEVEQMEKREALSTRPASPTPSPESTLSPAHVATRDGGGETFPRGAGTGTYFRRLPDDTWVMLNSGDQWVTIPCPATTPASAGEGEPAPLYTIEGLKRERDHYRRQYFAAIARHQAPAVDLPAERDRVEAWLQERIVATEQARDAYPDGDEKGAVLDGAIGAYVTALALVRRPRPDAILATRPTDPGGARGEQRDPIVGYMCLVDFDHELGEASGGNRVHPSLEDIQQARKCVAHCGIAEVEVAFRRIAQEPVEERPLPEPPAASTASSDAEGAE